MYVEGRGVVVRGGCGAPSSCGREYIMFVNHGADIHGASRDRRWWWWAAVVPRVMRGPGVPLAPVSQLPAPCMEGPGSLPPASHARVSRARRDLALTKHLFEAYMLATAPDGTTASLEVDGSGDRDAGAAEAEAACGHGRTEDIQAVCNILHALASLNIRCHGAWVRALSASIRLMPTSQRPLIPQVRHFAVGSVFLSSTHPPPYSFCF